MRFSDSFLKCFIFFIVILGCKNLNKPKTVLLNTVDKHYIFLGNQNYSKQFIVNFPFCISPMKSFHFRCTGSEPYCQVFGNSELEMSICHRFHNMNKYYNHICSEINQSYITNTFWSILQFENFENIQKDLDDEIKSRRLKFSGSTNIDLLPMHWTFHADLRTWTYGFFSKTPRTKYFIQKYLAANRNEFFSIEFSSNSNKIDSTFMQNEIQFIINNMKWEI